MHDRKKRKRGDREKRRRRRQKRTLEPRVKETVAESCVLGDYII